MSENREFAFGDNTHSGCPCPAIAAGYNPDNGGATLFAVEKYDEIATRKAEEHSYGAGTLPESQARKAWLEMIDVLAGREGERSRNAHDRAEEIDNELEWE